MKYDYSSKVITADQAAAMIKDHDTIKITFGCAGPTAFLKALKARAHELTDVGLRHGRLYAKGLDFHAQPEYWDHVQYRGTGCTTNYREALLAGKVENFPARFGELPRTINDGHLKYDALVFQCTPPDEYGFCSFGLMASSVPWTLKSFPLVIAEMNVNTPRTGGDFVHVRDIPYIIESNEPIDELPPTSYGPLEEAIGKHVASLIDDGSTLQLGIGSTPNAIMKALAGHKDLGIHTEVFGESVIDLVESGVVNGLQKTENRGKLTTSFINGTKRTFDFVNNNKLIDLRCVGYTNDTQVIARQHKMVAINACVQIDLLGQINAECFGDLVISNVGGQLDFALGSQWSKGGKYIVAISSTYKQTHSRIVSTLPPYTSVSVPKTVADYVVTEYGIAHLKGKSARQRARALIDIAHPDLREQLEREACERRDIHHV